MKANEFVKSVGITESKRIVRDNEILGRYRHLNVCHVDLTELYRLVESHELVEKYDGIESAKMMIEKTKFPLSDRIIRLKRAIADVESCTEVS